MEAAVDDGDGQSRRAVVGERWTTEMATGEVDRARWTRPWMVRDEGGRQEVGVEKIQLLFTAGRPTSALSL